MGAAYLSKVSHNVNDSSDVAHASVKASDLNRLKQPDASGTVPEVQLLEPPERQDQGYINLHTPVLTGCTDNYCKVW